MSTIFWDFDGTLVYSHHLWSGCMHAALTAVCPDTNVTFRQIRECNTRGFTWQTPEHDHSALVGDTWWIHTEAHAFCAFLSCGLSETDACTAASLVRGFILSPDRYHLYPDTLSVLEECKRRGHRNVILSNNYPELESTVTALGLLPLLDGVVTSAKEGFDKPRQELYTIAKAQFHDSAYYMIGDNPKADLLGGTRAGMTAFLVHNSCENAEHCFDTLTAVLKIIP